MKQPPPTLTRLLGSHLSIAGGLHNAIHEARTFGMTCLQVFTANQRQWKSRVLDDQEISQWQNARQQVGLERIVSHASYLVNLASPAETAFEMSIACFRDEILRCHLLQIESVVIHPGSHMSAGEEAGLARIVQAIDRLHKDLPGLAPVICLELTAGQGSCLGYRFEHLAQVLERVRQPERLGVCLDTAHMLAAGYDLTSRAGAEAVLEELERTIGLERVRVLHVNDSKTARGSRVDRHEHIGKGELSMDALRTLMQAPALENVPMILETPKGRDAKGKPWDAVNLSRLRKLLCADGGPAARRPAAARGLRRRQKA